MASVHRAKGNDAKKKSFEARYGMSAAEWRELKKKDPRKAHELREKARLAFISMNTRAKVQR